MNHVQDMLRTHPGEQQGDMELLTACIEACFECAQTCTACADACLGESHVQELTSCIRLNLDCADICAATGRLVTRQTAVDQRLWRDQLQACITACEVCGAECQQHADMHDHCRVCAEACRTCAEACRNLLRTVG
jgi:hypothetical protein